MELINLIIMKEHVSTKYTAMYIHVKADYSYFKIFQAGPGSRADLNRKKGKALNGIPCKLLILKSIMRTRQPASEATHQYRTIFNSKLIFISDHVGMDG